jgi:hypothetical protein
MDKFENHPNDGDAEYARAMAKSEALRRASDVADVTPRVTPIETDLSGGEVNSGRVPA